jgi:hypothetical protein
LAEDRSTVVASEAKQSIAWQAKTWIARRFASRNAGRYSLAFSQSRSPDGVERNPGFPHRIVTATDFAARHPGYEPSSLGRH